jgi:hypothetical protein
MVYRGRRTRLHVSVLYILSQRMQMRGNFTID